ncbi:MAG: HK97 family phage prohead protease [Proteobacteria bacterium]|nr:HK97 family phage prohead protease [Pseudomonadota bacterium]
MELLHKAIDFQVREVGDPADRILEFVGSTADVDRYGDIIEVAGWDLKNFKKNSPFLWAHNYQAPPVGKVVKAFTDERGLICHTYFPTDEEIAVQGWPSNIPTPETVYRLYKIGSLKATSVGFAGLEREPITDKKNGGQQTGWRYLKSELYELSAVPVPANPYAVIQQAVQKGVVTEKDVAPFLAAAEPEGEGDNGNHFAELRAKVRTLQGELEQAKEELAQVKAQAAAPLKFDLVLSEEQLEKIRAELELKTGVTPETRAGAVLNAKNKAALRQAQELIGQVLSAAEPASDEGKSVTPTKSIYSLALNPGDEPQGERPAGELSVDMAEILNLTKNFYQTVCPGK